MTNVATFFHSRETQRGAQWGLVPLNSTGPHSIQHKCKNKPCKWCPGSAGLDVAVSATTTLNDTWVHLLPTSVCGPLPFQTHASLLGRSSITHTGLFILPGTTDADYKEAINIMAWTPNPPCTVAQGSRLAQLIPLPAIPYSAPTLQQQRDAGGFGSTGTPQIFWLKASEVQQPLLTCQMESKSFTGLVNTRANVSIIFQKDWPSRWPLVIIAGDHSRRQRSADPLAVH